MYIASQEELEAFVARAATSTVLAIDTEFLREKTYYPQLCLVQMATEDEEAIIDPFGVDDLGVLAPLLQAPQITKIVHAGHQDIEILLNEVGCTPSPLFDTQLAAALLGQTQQIGYAALVHAICGVKLMKTDSFTDWSARPLTTSQLNYASADVRYLPVLYETMKARLEEKGRLHWLDGELAEMSDPATYDADEWNRYRRLKHAGALSRKQLAAAREAAAWRERTARKRNLPRKWVLTDEQIVEACKREPRSIDELFMVRGMRERMNTADARALLAAMVKGMDSDPSTWPANESAPRSERNVDPQVDMLMVLVRLRARENGIAVPTLANHSDLVQIARGHYEGAALLKGWRREIVGSDLLDMLEGRLSLRIANGRVSIVRLDD